jgi:PAS domain S-box-containing protein
VELTAEKINLGSLRQILDAFPGFIFAKNRDGRFTMVNKQLSEFYEKSEDELVGKTDEFLGYSLTEAEYFRKTDSEVFEKRRSGRIPLNSLRLSDGTVRWFNIVKSPVFDDAEEVVQVLVACYEITDRIQGELELKESEEKYRDLFQHASDAIFVINKDGFFQEANKAGNESLGVVNCIGRHISDFVHEDSKDAPIEYLKGLDSVGYVKNFRVNLLIHDEVKIIEINSTAMYDESGQRVASRDIIRDMTQRIAYENSLIETTRSAEDLNRLQANFLANMSHEIRTPINGLLGLTELIEQDFDSVEGLKDYTTLLKESGHRLLSTITSILDFSKLNENEVDLKLDDFCLVDKIKNYLPTMKILADRKNLSLTFVTELDCVQFHCDENILILILNNLIGNAIKFTKEGGVEVVLSEKTIRGKDFAKVQVNDTGIGIDPEFVPHLFEPFRHESTGLNRSYGGTGLGLSIVKKYVELFGGFLKVDSEKDRGTSFRLYLPKIS